MRITNAGVIDAMVETSERFFLLGQPSTRNTGASTGYAVDGLTPGNRRDSSRLLK